MSVLLISPKDSREILQLPHPRTASPCHFLLREDGSLFEIIELSQKDKQSLLFEDGIIGHAPIHVATPLDSTFLLIASLSNESRAGDRFVEAEELLDAYPFKLRSMLANHLHHVCDVLEPRIGDADFFRFSSGKAESYVRAKVNKVETRLPTSILEKLPAAETINILARRKAALELVCSYVPPAVYRSLLSQYDFAELTDHLAKSTSDYVNPNEFIAAKTEDGQTTNNTKKVKKGSKGVEALKKVNTRGMKSMTSFFAKKS